ncbi:MAG: DNA polymerase III [Gammaproteobacteria bacterium RIFCSPHIGHO2_12_FULL_37_34]|nr:MAG: DNA polymerase III [Gammaproteobacteria bacterium RIFCSPHIGHO2_12_FULL_37_34]
MTIHNSEIAAAFYKLANLLGIEGANPFRVRAYRNAARIIEGLTKSVAELITQGENLTDLPGIGNDLAKKITVLVETGKFPLLKETETRIPPVLNELLKIEGLGPARVKLLYKKLKIKNINDLKTAIEKGRVRKLARFGEKIEKKILQGILHREQYVTRAKLVDTISTVTALTHYIKNIKGVEKVECAGSFRRHKETVGDLDMVVAGSLGKKIIDHFIQFEEISEVISHGSTRSTVRLRSGMQVDLRVVPKKSYGAALLYFTGSKDHNIALRKIAVRKKLKMNEYGMFKYKKQLAGNTEEEMYRQIGLPYIEPELRENRGEIEAAQQDKLPKLITLNDMRGDLHCHTTATDGAAQLETMAKIAEEYGYEYLAITDHSKHLTIAHGLNKKTLWQQIKQIDKLNHQLKKIIILKSIEVDILENGSFDLPPDILKELDLRICSIHSNFHLSSEEQTNRIKRAMDNPLFNILAHPTGRLINRREPYTFNIEQVMHAAKERGCILELNAQPDRLDLNDLYCKAAKEIGVKIAISSDAHSTNQFAYMHYGIFQARRGWLTKNDVINTQPLSNLKKLLKR